MSYDIKLWSVNKVKFRESLSKSDQWEIHNGSAYLRKSEWQIAVNESTYVEDDSIPSEVYQVLPGISYVTELNLEPYSAPDFARNLQLKVSKSIAKDVIGVIEDPQKNELISPAGIKRFVPIKREHNERFSIIDMEWKFVNNNSSNEKILLQIIKYFEKYLPEALPRRYGEYEPPQYTFLDQGKDHLKKYLKEHLYDSIVWYPSKPVMSFNYFFARDWGFSYAHGKRYFSSNGVSITFDVSTLRQLGWRRHLLKVFKDISMIVNPYYAEVRILHNQIYGRGTYSLDDKSEESPIIGRWTGIPKKLGQAVVIGDPYIDYLPEIKEKGEKLGTLYFASVGDWNNDKNINDIIGNTPSEVAQIKSPKTFMTYEESLSHAHKEDHFPPVFPFDKKANG